MATHSSIFSYNLSRSYPFKWFTPVALIGGLAVVVLVSFLNVATAGYQLVSITSPNPNLTESSQQWWGHWPSFLIGSMRASCEPTTIPLASQLYTNNTALPYTLTDVWQEDATGQKINYGSLVYHNNPLQNCTSPEVYIYIRTIDGRTTTQIVFQPTGAYMMAYVTCQVDTAQGSMMVNLNTNYELIPAYGSEVFYRFPGRNATSKASLFLGESLLAMYWSQFTILYSLRSPMFSSLRQGLIYFERTGFCAKNASALESIDYWPSNCYFFTTEANNTAFDPHYCIDNSVSGLTKYGSSAYDVPSNIWIPADSLSKSLYYTIMADLGQNNSTCVSPLVDPGLLEYYTANFTAINKLAAEQPPYEFIKPADTQLAIHPYTVEQNASQYDLGIHPSTLATNYLCQVPKLKPTGTLIFAVLIADLVLLQGLWKLFTFCVSCTLTKRHPEMNYCAGCSEREGLMPSGRTSPTVKQGRTVYQRVFANKRDPERSYKDNSAVAHDAD